MWAMPGAPPATRTSILPFTQLEHVIIRIALMGDHLEFDPAHHVRSAARSDVVAGLKLDCRFRDSRDVLYLIAFVECPRSFAISLKDGLCADKYSDAHFCLSNSHSLP
jgi:hypothetical protein